MANDLLKKTINKSIQLYGGRSGGRVRHLIGPSNSVVRGGRGRAFVTDAGGRVILDITRERTKPVDPGKGFGAKRNPTKVELELLAKVE